MNNYNTYFNENISNNINNLNPNHASNYTQNFIENNNNYPHTSNRFYLIFEFFYMKFNKRSLKAFLNQQTNNNNSQVQTIINNYNESYLTNNNSNSTNNNNTNRFLNSNSNYSSQLLNPSLNSNQNVRFSLQQHHDSNYYTQTSVVNNLTHNTEEPTSFQGNNTYLNQMCNIEFLHDLISTFHCF